MVELVVSVLVLFSARGIFPLVYSGVPSHQNQRFICVVLISVSNFSVRLLSSNY